MLEKFPVIQVPRSYWKKWEAVMKTIYQSLRVSGFYPGSTVHKSQCIWLQHSDRSHIIRKCDNNVYIIYTLKTQSRKHCCYNRVDWRHTAIANLNPYHFIHVYERDNLIFTDGYNNHDVPATEILPTKQAPIFVTMQRMIENFFLNRTITPQHPPSLSIIQAPCSNWIYY